jgi:phosphate uptake regulator
MKKKTARRTSPRRQSTGTSTAQSRFRNTWEVAVARVTEAEARVQKEVRALLRRSKIGTQDAATMLRDVRALVERERKKGLKQLEGRLAALQSRVRTERKSAARTIEGAVQGALARFNIPSRQEVQELTRKVNELSRKIESARR